MLKFKRFPDDIRELSLIAPNFASRPYWVVPKTISGPLEQTVRKYQPGIPPLSRAGQMGPKKHI
jgi:hypothetical protein